MARNRNTNRQPQQLHRCQFSGKRRFRTPKDAKIALRSAAMSRSRAQAESGPTGEATSSRWEVRYYPCPCGGYHLTSRPDIATTSPSRTVISAASGMALVAAGAGRT